MHLTSGLTDHLVLDNQLGSSSLVKTNLLSHSSQCFKSQNLSLNLKLTETQEAPTSASLPWDYKHVPPPHFWGLNSIPHACPACTLPSEFTPQPHKLALEEASKSRGISWGLILVAAAESRPSWHSVTTGQPFLSARPRLPSGCLWAVSPTIRFTIQCLLFVAKNLQSALMCSWHHGRLRSFFEWYWKSLDMFMLGQDTLSILSFVSKKQNS